MGNLNYFLWNVCFLKKTIKKTTTYNNVDNIKAFSFNFYCSVSAHFLPFTFIICSYHLTHLLLFDFFTICLFEVFSWILSEINYFFISCSTSFDLSLLPTILLTTLIYNGASNETFLYHFWLRRRGFE